jgi:putative DNA primase/helicase
MKLIPHVPPEHTKTSSPFDDAPAVQLNGVQPESLDSLEIARLANLGAIDYDRERKVAAGQLGVRVSTLDKSVAAERPADESKVGQGRPLELPKPEPWPAPVDGVALVAELTAAIRKYVVLSEQDALAAALWVLHTYCFDAFACTPRLAVTSPEKRCGKTTLLDVIGLLVPRPLSTANISAAATFRTIETARPTLLVDEADTFLGENEELRGILNSGHHRGGQVIRTVGDDFEARAFSTHCPVAIAQIGKLPDTLADRSVHISMKRRAAGEAVARFRHGRAPEFTEAARKAARWTADNAEAIRGCDPVIPDAIFNRDADNWAPLLAIAEVAGAVIAGQARQAALAACGVDEDLSPRVALLADIREVFVENSGDRMSSANLVGELVAMADKPWGECNHGKALTQNSLARRLKSFGIFHEKIGPKTNRVNGYSKVAFADAFSRYLPNSPIQSGHSDTANEINELGENGTGHYNKRCPDLNRANPLNLKNVFGCPDENPGTGVRRLEL